MPAVSRAQLSALIALVVILFVAVSLALARILGADGAERDAVTTLVGAEQRGDVSAMVARLQGCATSPSCRAMVAVRVRSLRRPGPLSFLQVATPPPFDLGARTATTRVAWRADGALPVVQCVVVHRSGNVLRGFAIHVLSISAPIDPQGGC